MTNEPLLDRIFDFLYAHCEAFGPICFGLAFGLALALITILAVAS